MTITDDRTRTDVDPTTGEPRCTHIVPGDDETTGIAKVMEARVNGTAVTALCGHTWVPERDPKQYPLCSKCKEIYDATSDAFGLGDRDPWEIKS